MDAGCFYKLDVQIPSSVSAAADVERIQLFCALPFSTFTPGDNGGLMFMSFAFRHTIFLLKLGGWLTNIVNEVELLHKQLGRIIT